MKPRLPLTSVALACVGAISLACDIPPEPNEDGEGNDQTSADEARPAEAALAPQAHLPRPVGAQHGDEDLDLKQQALSGKISWPSWPSWGYGHHCSAAHQDLIRNAMLVALDQVFTNPGRLLECMKDSFTSFEWAANVTNSPEEVMRFLQDDTTITVRCRDDGGKSATSTTEIPGESSSIVFMRWFLDANINNPLRVASVLLHEFLHTRHYKHPATSDESTSFPGNTEYTHSVPEQVEACVLKVGAGVVPASGNGTARSALPREALLAPAGLPGGDPSGVECIGNRLANGIHVRSGAFINQLGLSCKTPGAIEVVNATAAGGGGGTPGARSCFSGELLVGLHGRVGTVLDSVGPVCANESSIRSRSSQAFLDPTFGGSGGTAFVRRCPPGMAVRGIRMRTGDLVDRIELECQDIDRRETHHRTFAPWAGKQSDWYRSIDSCPGRGALTGIAFAETSDHVHRLGGICRHIESDIFFDYPSHLETITPVRGYINATNGELRCPANQVIVGFKYAADGGGLLSLAPTCAIATNWSIGSSGLQLLPWIGADRGGTQGVTMCPASHFAIGWQIEYNYSKVIGVRPLCREFVN